MFGKTVRVEPYESKENKNEFTWGIVKYDIPKIPQLLLFLVIVFASGVSRAEHEKKHLSSVFFQDLFTVYIPIN